MAQFDPSTFASLDPQNFAALVRSTPDKQISEVMQSELRGKILDEVFGRMPTYFRADRAGHTTAVIHWVVTDRPDGGADTYEVVIADGTCTVAESAQREPSLTLTLGPVEFLKVVSSNANPVMLFMTGKLKATGDLGLASNIANLFNLPKA